MMKFNKGDRVVPVSKTVKGWEGLEGSNVWNEAKERGQNFLYVTDFDIEENAYVCDYKDGTESGDFYNGHDLVLYVEPKFKAGDQVRQKYGDIFSSGDRIVTVDRVEPSKYAEGNKVYFKETGTWLSEEEIELVPIPAPAVEPEEDENEPYRRCVDHFSDLEPAEQECCQCAELECKACEPVPEWEHTELLEYKVKELEEKVRELENQKDELKFIIKILAGQF